MMCIQYCAQSLHAWLRSLILFTGATIYGSSSTFGSGVDPVFLSNLGCSGSEMTLLQCSHSNYIQLGSVTYCDHNRDVGLKCQRRLFMCHFAL